MENERVDDEILTGFGEADPRYRMLALEQRVAELESKLAQSTERVALMWAFLGPHVDGTRPPLDGVELPTKAWVDEQVARIARRLREQITEIEGKSIAAAVKAVARSLTPVMDAIDDRSGEPRALRDRLRAAAQAFISGGKS